ncbi:hypothetical protein HOG21_06720 [bacterium]|nr:hypothetical protein [bacterium]
MWSTSFIVIFALVTSISNILFFLLIVNFTFVHAGHLTQEITSLKELFFVISFQSIFNTISHPINHAFSEGDQGNGDTILNSQGVNISTYDPIHS